MRRTRRDEGPARCLLAASTLLCRLAVAGADQLRFLVMSAPRTGKISWIRLPEGGDFAGLRPQTLIDEGLQHPQGLCVDRRRRRLYVADPDMKRIYAYRLAVVNGALVTDGARVVVNQGVESRWVSVDGSGTLFFSDEPGSRILRVSASDAIRGGAAPSVVYSGSTVAQVSEPGGVAADNFHVFWTNKHFGTETGSLVRGAVTPGARPFSLATNSPKSYGVCIAMGNVFYTDSERSVYGAKKNGGGVAEVTNALQRPRGCAWDGDGTVYVADRGAGSVYAFASNMHVISRAQMREAFEFDDAFGLALVTAAGRRGARASWLGAAAACVLALAAGHL